MPSTTARGYPFPVGTDRVMDGDNAIEALAQAIDSDANYTRATTKGQSVALNVATDVVWNAPNPNECALTQTSSTLWTITKVGTYVISCTFVSSHFAGTGVRAYLQLSVGVSATPDNARAVWSSENTATCSLVRRCIVGDIIKASVLGNDEAFSVQANLGWLNVARLAR